MCEYKSWSLSIAVHYAGVSKSFRTET